MIITSTDYNPNIRFLKHYIISFEEKYIDLYDIQGFTYNVFDMDFDNDSYYHNNDIIDIFIIDDNYLIAISERDLL